MKKLLKILGGIVLLILFLAGAGLAYLYLALPDGGEASNTKIEATPELIARGEYLANHVTVCIDCHSTRDFNYYSGPLLSKINFSACGALLKIM